MLQIIFLDHKSCMLRSVLYTILYFLGENVGVSHFLESWLSDLKRFFILKCLNCALDVWVCTALTIWSVVNKFYQAGCSSNGVKLYFRNMQFYLGQVVWSDSASVWFSSSQTHFLVLIVVFSLHLWWRLRQYVPLKHCLSPTMFCSVITQETDYLDWCYGFLSSFIPFP